MSSRIKKKIKHKKRKKVRFPRTNKKSIRKQYEIGDEIGRGGFSIVVEAVHKKSSEVVAIKIVDRKDTSSKEMLQEIQVMAQFDHEHIVKYREIFIRKDEFWVVLEKIDGGELFDRIVQLSHYSEKEASHVAKQAFEALKYMHDMGFAHRDLKPENLLLSSNAPDASVKLADFGFAVLCDGPLDEYVGTPPYMAPELIVLEDDNHPGTYGKEVDIWAMGVILYILLSGVHPFQMDEDEMFEAITNGDWEWLGDTWDYISSDAKDLVMGMMNYEIETRLTIDECLGHEWIETAGNRDEKLDIQTKIRKFQNRKKLKAAIFSVIATNRLARSLNALKALVPSENGDNIEELEGSVSISDSEQSGET